MDDEFKFRDHPARTNADLPLGRCGFDPPLDLHGPDNAYERLADPDPFVSLAYRYAQAALRWPDRLAIVDEEHAVTHAELAGRIRAMASLIEARTSPGETIALLPPGGAELWAAVFACCAADRSFAVLDLHHPPARNARILQDGAFSCVLTPPATPLPPGARRIDPAARSEGSIPWPPSPRSSAVYSLYTSGSTGAPKGVVNTQASLLQRSVQQVAAGHFRCNDRSLTTSGPATISGLREGLSILLCGGTLHLLDVPRAGLGGLATRLHEAGITLMYTVPSVLRALGQDSATARAAFASLRVLRLGGEMVAWSDIALARTVLPRNCFIQLAYSATETTGTQWFVPPDMVADTRLAPAGYVLPGVTFDLADETGSPVPEGGIGELVVTGPHVMLGHWVAGRCISDAVQQAGDGRRLRTGDLFRRRPDGLWEMHGRADRQVKIHGQRVQPAEIEAFLRTCPDIADALVLHRTDSGTVRLVAFVARSAGCTPSIAALRAALAEALPPPMRPARLHVLDELPRLPGGKVDAASLMALDDAPPAPGAPNHPDLPVPGPIARAVRQAWRAVLGPRAAGNASFEAEGGDSLKFLQFVLGLETRLEIRLPLDLVHGGMTQADIAQVIDRLPQTAADLEDDTPRLMLLPGLAGDEPRLARFRAGLRGRLRLVLVDIPDWTETAREGGDFECLAERVAARIMALAPTGPLPLAGYSFGGTLAVATARHLRAAGRDVPLLALLDTGLTLHAEDAANPIDLEAFSSHLRRDLARRDFSMSGALALSKAARSLSLVPLLARHGSWRRLVGDRTLALLDRHLRLVQRHCMAAEWRRLGPPRLPGLKCVLFRSQAYPADAPPDLGWERLLDHVRVVPVPGGHHTMFDPPACDRLLALFVEAVQQELASKAASHQGAAPPD